MKVTETRIKIKDLVKGFSDNGEGGVFGLDGNLSIRPSYQREFVYKEKQQQAVIESVRDKMPLSLIYWIKNKDGSLEVMDGQQRIMSICSYVNGGFSINYQYFHNLTQEEKDQILEYELMVAICSDGTEREKLQWFEKINIAGEKLTSQELRNAVFGGKFVNDAKRWFSRTSCPAGDLASNYVKGSTIRQDYLETALKWISGNNVDAYMAEKQHQKNANELWGYFQSVITWVQATFSNYRKEMKGLNWGGLYNMYHKKVLDVEALEAQISKLMQDDDVTKKAGIYEYLLTGDTKFLSIRAFPPAMKRKVFEKQKGLCPSCGKVHELKDMEADHITPWSQGGKTVEDNCQMLCKKCNRTKSDK